MSTWYYINGGQRFGPIDDAQIRAHTASGHVKGDDFVWREGLPQWISAKDAGLMPPAGRATRPPPPPTVTAQRPAPAPSRMTPVAAEQYTARPITLTPAAANAVLQICREQKLSDKSFLRVACNQKMGVFRYELDIQEDPGPPDSDFEFVSNGVRIVMARKLTPYIGGCIIDFREKDGGVGFVFTNPNATSKPE